MRDINEPSPALAANAALSALQTKLAAQNLEVASSHLLDLIRTLRLSALLMDEAVIAEEEREEYNIAIESAETAAEESAILEAEILKLRGQDICENS